ncbi:MAG: hypothetical protein LW730_04655 [Xanthomonadaceae bacterium]|nr:hypothetical protein [Xanthomonadaceae bacterium]
MVAVKHIADDRTADNEADPGTKPLNESEYQQLLQVGGQRATDGRNQENSQTSQNDRPAPEGIRQRTVQQRHRGVAQQIDADGLLDCGIGHLQIAGQCPKRRKNAVDGKRTDHR